MFSEWKFTAKDIAEKPDLFMSGHRACAGCAPATVLRLIMKAVRGPTIVTFATGCMEVVSTIYPYTSWKIPYMHTAFENVAANASGIETALKILKKKGRIPQENVDVIAFAGDGGTYDIGIQALRGGDNPGEHTVMFVGKGERLELIHRSTTRDHFARGAVRAAAWLVGRAPGLYEMDQVLGLSPGGDPGSGVA